MKNLILTLVLITAISGCRSAAVVEDNDLGSFHGKLALLGVDGNLLTQQSGATIQLEGTGFNTTSDAAGDWTISNVPAGIYNIIWQKPGFDTIIGAQYPFSGAGTSFLPYNAIQAIPLDSLVFTVTNSGQRYVRSIDSLGDSIYGYEGTVRIEGSISGPDQLTEGSLSFSLSIPDSGQDTYFTPGVVSIGSDGHFLFTRQYSEPTVKSGTIVTIRMNLAANWPANRSTYAYVARARSPYVVTRTITLP